MASINTITVSGNLTADPELRHTSNEVPYTKFRVAVSRGVYDPETKKWTDHQDGFFNATAWRGLAEHVRTSLRKGDRVTLTGRMTRKTYEADIGDGKTETRTVHEIEVDDIGPSLRWRSWARLDARRPADASTATGDDPDAQAPEGSLDNPVVTPAA